MAGQLINVTRSIVTNTTGATEWQEGALALEVLGYPGARFDFNLKVYALAGTSVLVKLYTSMHNDDNNGTWTLLGTFASVTAANATDSISVTSKVLRYVKWKVETTAITMLSFEILGVAW